MTYVTDVAIYCYPKSNVLINKFNVRDLLKLEEVERESTEFKMIILESSIFENKLNQIMPYNEINELLLRNIHKFIFEEIYEWSGSYRTVRITKGNTVFCYPENIQSEIFNWIISGKVL